MKILNKEKKLNQKGFTLVEVLAVIVIIGILGLVAIPSVLTAMNRSKTSSYDILVQDIKTASYQLIDELDYAGSEIYQYNTNGATSTKIAITKTEASGISTKKVEVNLQTLVSNGFLTGTNNDNTSGTNKNEKILLNPKNNQDMGICQIIITKQTNKNNHSKVSYSLENKSTGNTNCPTTTEYQ